MTVGVLILASQVVVDLKLFQGLVVEILKQERLGNRVPVIVSALRNIFWSVRLSQGLLRESLVEFLEAIGVSVVIFRVHK